MSSPPRTWSLQSFQTPPSWWNSTRLSVTLFWKASPGDPTSLVTDLNPNMNEEAIKRIRAHYGLDQPWYVQYWKWLSNMMVLDFGRSFAPDNRPVIDKILERIPITLLINILSMILIMGIAIPIGVMSAVKQNSLFDKGTTLFVFLGFAIPTYWLALLLMILFGVHLNWLPISGFRSLNYAELGFFERILDVAKHLILPARAKGLDEKTVIFKHALRNALLPVITLLGLSVPGLIGGSVIFETIFAIPGMGQLFYQAVMMRDYPTIMGILVIGAILTLFGNLLADVMYSVADPRIRVSE